LGTNQQDNQADHKVKGKELQPRIGKLPKKSGGGEGQNQKEETLDLKRKGGEKKESQVN